MSFAVFAGVTSAVRGVGSIKNYRDSKDAAAETDALAKKNAQLQRAENAEVERRQVRTDAQVMGEAKARRYASGYSSEAGTSGDMYNNAVEVEQARQMTWLKESGESKAQLIEQQGSIAAGNIRREGEGELYSAFGDFAQAGFYASEGGMFRADTPAPNTTKATYGNRKLTVPANATNDPWSSVG